jgi:hypothetical protein
MEESDREVTVQAFQVGMVGLVLIRSEKDLGKKL